VQAFCTLLSSSVSVPVSSFASVRVNGRDYFIAVIQSDSGPGYQHANCCNVRDAFGE
jgi:hypothetical protein